MPNVPWGIKVPPVKNHCSWVHSKITSHQTFAFMHRLAASRELSVFYPVWFVYSCVSWPIWQISHDAKYMISERASGHQPTAAETQGEYLRAERGNAGRKPALYLWASSRMKVTQKTIPKDKAGQRAFAPKLKSHSLPCRRSWQAHPWLKTEKCFHRTTHIISTSQHVEAVGNSEENKNLAKKMQSQMLMFTFLP